MLSTPWADASEYGRAAWAPDRLDCSILWFKKAAPPSCPPGFGTPKGGNGAVTSYSGDGSSGMTCMEVNKEFDLTDSKSATCGGTANGASCGFPFTYRGKQYNQCITDD